MNNLLTIMKSMTVVISLGLAFIVTTSLDASTTTQSKSYRNLDYTIHVTYGERCAHCNVVDVEHEFCKFTGSVTFSNTTRDKKIRFETYFDIQPDNLRARPCAGLHDPLPEEYLLPPGRRVTYHFEAWYIELERWEVRVANYREYPNEELFLYPGRDDD